MDLRGAAAEPPIHPTNNSVCKTTDRQNALGLYLLRNVINRNL